MNEPQQIADALIAQFAGALESIDDPADRARTTGAALNSIPGLQGRLREIRQEAAQALRSGGASHADVAEILGVSRARAAQIAAGQTSRAAAQSTAE